MKTWILMMLAGCIGSALADTKGMDELSALHGQRATLVRDHVLEQFDPNGGKGNRPWQGLTTAQRETALLKIENHLLFFHLLDQLSQQGENLYFDFHAKIPGFRPAWEAFTGRDWESFDPAAFASAIATTEEEEFRFTLAERFWPLSKNEQLEATLSLMHLAHQTSARGGSSEIEP